MTNFIINKEGLSITGSFYILVKRVKNDRNGNPKYNITIFNKEGRNVGYILKKEGKIKYRLLKDNSFNITSYTIYDDIEFIANVINN